MSITLKCHKEIGDKVQGIALVSDDNFSARYDLDRIKGIFSRPAHKLHGESYEKKILVMNTAKGGVALSSFDIVHTRISTEGNSAVFHMEVSAKAGQSKPAAIGQLAGSDVFSYVWPTTIDSYEAGFERQAGILALAVTAHPDFDDTPLFDENGDGDTANDGNVWHSHWAFFSFWSPHFAILNSQRAPPGTPLGTLRWPV